MLSFINKNLVILMSLFKFFDTAPKTKSNKVAKLEKAGKSGLLLEAIEAERQARKSGEGATKKSEGGITVKRVGEYS